MSGVPAESYIDPWSISFDSRFKNFMSGSKRLAYFYEQPDNSTFRYRVYNMIQVIQANPHWGWSASFFSYEDRGRLERVVDSAHALVICRTRYNDEIAVLIARARAKRAVVVYDIDDFVFDSSYVQLIVETLDQDLKNPTLYDFWFAYTARLGAVMRLCDGVITTNSYLGERVAEFSRLPVWIVPNFLNKEQMDVSEKVVLWKRSMHNDRNTVSIGYFSGTPSHNKDFSIAQEALASILDDYRDVTLRIVGYLDLRGRIMTYSSRIKMTKLVDFVNLQRYIGDVDINIIPLQDNLFTNCKSELKYFEAGIVETLSLASPTWVYTESIADRENGFLVYAHEWEAALREVIESSDKRKQVALAACADSKAKFAWYNQTTCLKKVVDSF